MSSLITRTLMTYIVIAAGPLLYYYSLQYMENDKCSSGMEQLNNVSKWLIIVSIIGVLLLAL